MESPEISKYNSCARCLQDIKTKEFLKCWRCNKYYDLRCTNVSEKRFYNTMREEHKTNWKCENCLNAEQECKGNDDSPLSNITMRHRPRKTTTSVTSEVAANPASDLATELRLLREEMKAVRTEIQEFKSAVSGLTSTVSACCGRIDDLTARVEALESRQNEPPAAISAYTLEQTIADLKLELNDRDQDMLSNDIEIAGIPEENNERSTHIILAVSTKLGIVLEERDIVSAERAGAVRRSGPGQLAIQRPLVVRLARRTQRDELLAAARVRRSITTAGLGLSSTERRFYVNERLTRYNRLIFFKARNESQRANWKYVWTRDGKIFTRKEHGEPRHRLRSMADIAKIFG